EIERLDVGVPGGLQDQYSASFGGFNLIEFRNEREAVVNPLRIEPEILHELEYNMLLVYTGATRASNRIITSQIAGLSDRQPPVVEAMDRMKQLTLEAKDARRTGRRADFAEIVHAEWQAKGWTSDSGHTPQSVEMYAE